MLDKNKKFNKLISVIIPFYNADGYLEHCLKSLLTQTYSNFELICIDDGSTDETWKKLVEWEKVDRRILIFSQSNSGQSAARNRGLSLSTGAYVTFVDSDDYVSPKYLEHLIQGIVAGSEVSMVNKRLVTNYTESLGESNTYDQKVKRMSAKEGIIEVLSQHPDNEVWGKMFEKKLFCGSFFLDGKIYEDLVITYELLCKAEYISYLNIPDYFYVQRSDSTINKPFDEKKMDVIEMGNKMKSIVLKRFPDLQANIMSRLFAAYSNVWFQINSDDVKNEHYQNLLWNQILICRKSMRIRSIRNRKVLLGFFASMLGPKTFRRIYLMRKRLYEN
ncbi:glycosyltransferase family 2 protein [Lactiplantibacillus paraxiangfangensis]|uniref:glycosyltransferase family 2 protein n=1 Tax=Lactiplantibacillus paraxiangfangensis TaxID=3076224 RepID=UPI0030C76C29